MKGIKIITKILYIIIQLVIQIIEEKLFIIVN